MLDQKKLDKIHLEDGLKIERMESEAKNIETKQIAEIQEKTKILSDKLHSLTRQKINILRSPLPKSELLELAKEAWKETRRRLLFDEFLVPFLKIAQDRREVQFFENIHLRIDFLKAVYCIFTAEDIEEAVKALPDDGLSESEIEAEVKKLDKEMAALQNELRKK